MLDKQIDIYSLDTGNFYDNRESSLHWLNHKLRSERNQLLNGAVIKGNDGKTKKTIVGVRNIESKFESYGVDKDGLTSIAKDEYDFSLFGDDAKELNELGCEYRRLKNLVSMKNAKIGETKEKLLALLSNKVEANIASNGRHHIRKLRDNQVSEKNIISVFDSYFTRTIGAKPDELCEDFMVIQVYYFDMIKDLIYNGFEYNCEKYIYFTSSAGQIRTKKCVFVKESTWKKHEKTIMCGLTIDDINAHGGNNPNKHLAYMALANSATDVWNEFDIDKAIVIDDFETDVIGTYDLIDDADYSIKRITGNVPIPHTDGAGMMLPCLGRNRMVRLPWVKGLLGAFDFKKFIEVNECPPVIKDIYGKEHNIIDEDIQIIFTKSQFKMNKYYESWDQYKEMFKRYGCTAGVTNVEEERIKDATINYQMLQTLTDVTDEELADIAFQSTNKLENLCGSVESIKDVFGATPYNTNKTAFQKAIDLYPALLNDEYAKSQLRDIKDSMVKRFKAGKLKVHGKYTFLLPDFYAACEHWFMGKDNPDGLLEDGEVFCWLFRKDEKLDCLRSPHLFMEHAIRKNVACYAYGDRKDSVREWFGTDAVYTSCKDMISKILQFDVDGDKSLVVADKTLIAVAERNLKKFDIVPLYYNMRKAEPVHLDNAAIYGGLHAAFVGGNIGIYSNNISKIWNSEVFISGTDEDKKRAVDVIRLLCMENNFVIDYAKTLYKPERPDYEKELITGFTKDLLPHFFVYAKDKKLHQVSDINNSLVNKLNDIIPNPRINCRKLGLDKIDYTLMMKDVRTECRVSFTDRGKIIKEETDPLIVKYCELNKKYQFALNDAVKGFSSDDMSKSRIRRDLKYRKISKEIYEELSSFGYDDFKIVDILVKFLYGIKGGKNKMALWLCYGDVVYDNLSRNVKRETRDVQCADCGEWFEVGIKDTKTCRCHECAQEHKRELARLRKKKQRETQKSRDQNI